MLYQILEQRLLEAVRSFCPEVQPGPILVRPCPNPRFGDYQTSGLITLAKERRTNPRSFATEIVQRLDVSPWCEPVEVAGAGFVNFRLKPAAVMDMLNAAARGEHLFFQTTRTPRRVVIDFSSPNVAKPMHVGHIRSTILGDCLGRVLRLLGHRVITDNHLGDWGTPFGLRLVGWKEQLDRTALQADPIGEMVRLYKTVLAASEADPALLERARQELVKLQAGDPENLNIWREMIALSQSQFDRVYDRLGVRFDHTLGESFYNPRLKPVVHELRELGLARESDGAIVVFFDDVPDLKGNPALIQKKDGAANYTTTDLATLAHRLESWRPDDIVYVTDARQQLHFRQLFEVFRRWRPEAQVKLVHVWFGMILGDDGKPFKTRAGENIKLTELLDEAEERAFRMVTEKNPDLGEAPRREIARIVGLGALKYADLSPNRQSDYVFSWEKMLALHGNTAPYLQYAYTRIRSIFRNAVTAEAGLAESAAGVISSLSTPEEMAVAKHLLNFGVVLNAVAEEYRPNYLCSFLYELAGHFTRFYERCPVLKAGREERASRLVLCELTGRVLNQGLGVLGIETAEQM